MDRLLTLPHELKAGVSMNWIINRRMDLAWFIGGALAGYALFFVHAGLKPHLTIEENLEQNDEKVFMWEREHLGSESFSWEKTVVCGHTPRPEPINRDKLILIDTGCVYHMQPGMGRLTAVRLPEREFIDVEYAD